jgi:hypothetical protein
MGRIIKTDDASPGGWNSKRMRRGPPTEATLLVDLAELLFQLRCQRLKTFARGVIRLPGELSGLEDLHFEFYALVFRGHSRSPPDIYDGDLSVLFQRTEPDSGTAA